MLILIWGEVATGVQIVQAAAALAAGAALVYLNGKWRAYKDRQGDELFELFSQGEPCEVPSDGGTLDEAMANGGIRSYETNPDGSPKMPGGGKGGPIEY